MVRPASIRWQDNTPVSATFSDPYFSLTDPLGEVHHTFISGVGLPELCSQNHLVIAETGFGTGLNFLLSVDCWLKYAQADARLTYISIEGHPLSEPDFNEAHRKLFKLPHIGAELRQAWPGAVAGIHRITLLNGRIRLLLLFGEVEVMLHDQCFAADAWYLDGFAPARNPAMWTDNVFQAVARLSRPQARIASFTAAGEVRRGLEANGFVIERVPGFAQKRHCIRGELKSVSTAAVVQRPPWTRLPPAFDFNETRPSIAIVGAGIAGRALQYNLQQENIEATLIGGAASNNTAGSGVPRALIAPRLVRGSDAYATFWAQAYIDAIRELDRLDDGKLWQGKRGLLFRFKGDDQSGLRKLAERLEWPESWLQLISTDTADGKQDALWFPKSGAIDPQRLFQLLRVTEDINADIVKLRREADSWHLIGSENKTVFEADLVILACGSGSVRLLDRPAGLRIGSGQLLSLLPPHSPDHAVLHDGYLTTADDSGRVIAGATISRDQPREVIPISAAATDNILQRLLPYLGEPGAGSDLSDISAWTGARCDTTDHLPLVGPLQNCRAFDRDYAALHHGVRLSTLPDASWQPGLFVLSGLGARGFQAAFLLADQLVSMITGRPRPLAESVSADLLPGRFQIRDLKRRQAEP